MRVDESAASTSPDAALQRLAKVFGATLPDAVDGPPVRLDPYVPGSCLRCSMPLETGRTAQARFHRHRCTEVDR